MSSINTEVGIYKRKILRKKKLDFDKEKSKLRETKTWQSYRPRKKKVFRSYCFFFKFPPLVMVTHTFFTVVFPLLCTSQHSFCHSALNSTFCHSALHCHCHSALHSTSCCPTNKLEIKIESWYSKLYRIN